MKKLKPLIIVSIIIILGLFLLSGLRNELEFHLDSIQEFNSKIGDTDFELSKTDVDEEGNMKLLGYLNFRVVLEENQFNNFWAEQTDFDLANKIVIVEMDSELNKFQGDIKFDNNKSYYEGSDYFVYEEAFHSQLNFNLAEVYVKLPQEAFLANGKIDPEYEYNMYITFKSVLYNSDSKNKKPVYTKNNVKYSFNIVETNGRYKLIKLRDAEVINQKTPITLGFFDKIKNGFKNLIGD